MTSLNKPVARMTNGQVREAGKKREVVVIIRPPNILGFRAKGCRKEYQLTVETCYTMAVRAQVMWDKVTKRKAKGKANV